MAAIAVLYDGLLPRPLQNFPLPPLSASSRAIVIGMGGGCDVFAATALGRLWQSQSPEGATVLFANCIGARPLPDDQRYRVRQRRNEKAVTAQRLRCFHTPARFRRPVVQLEKLPQPISLPRLW